MYVTMGALGKYRKKLREDATELVFKMNKEDLAEQLIDVFNDESFRMLNASQG